MSKLRIAAMDGDVRKAQTLLQVNPSRSYPGPPLLEEQAEALLLAAARGHRDIVALLLEARAPVDRIFPGGTALHAAVMGNFPEIVALLLDAGADPDVSDRQLGSRQQGWTALMYAACYGRAEITHQLLQAGATADLADRDGQTALMIAANAGHTAVALLLLEAGAQLNARDYYGNTALACALAHDGEGRALAQSLASLAQVSLDGLDPIEANFTASHFSYQVISEVKLRPWNWGSGSSGEDRNPSPSAAIAQRP